MKKIDEHLDLPNTAEDETTDCPCTCTGAATEGEDAAEATYSTTQIAKHYDVAVVKPGQ